MFKINAPSFNLDATVTPLMYTCVDIAENKIDGEKVFIKAITTVLNLIECMKKK